jgi:type VI secretion system secreted protein VgrG
MRLQRLCFLILPLLTLPAYADSILGSAGSFAVLGASTVTNTGTTNITGDVGVYAGSAVTGFPPGIVTGGTIYSGGSVAQQAQADTTTAYNTLAGMAVTQNLTGEVLGQNVGTFANPLAPGVYDFTSSAQLTGALYLNAEGNNDAFWVFQIGSTLTTASASSVNFVNLGGTPDDGLFWQVGSSATLGTTTTFEGNILALASITLDTGASIDCGRALAQTGAVTMDTNTISTGCAGLSGTNSAGSLAGTSGLSEGIGAGPSPVVPEPGSMALLGSGMIALVRFARRRRLS